MKFGCYKTFHFYLDWDKNKCARSQERNKKKWLISENYKCKQNEQYPNSQTKLKFFFHTKFANIKFCRRKKSAILQVLNFSVIRKVAEIHIDHENEYLYIKPICFCGYNNHIHEKNASTIHKIWKMKTFLL